MVHDDVASVLTGDITRGIGAIEVRFGDHHNVLAVRTRGRTAVERANGEARPCGGVVDEVRAKTVVVEAHSIESESVLRRIEIQDGGVVRVRAVPWGEPGNRVVELEDKGVLAVPAAQLIPAVTGKEDIVTGTAVELVIVLTGDARFVAAVVAVEVVIAFLSEDPVIACAAEDSVRAPARQMLSLPARPSIQSLPLRSHIRSSPPVPKRLLSLGPPWIAIQILLMLQPQTPPDFSIPLSII